MSIQSSEQDVEIVTEATGRGWRVRIFDGERTQFVSGFAQRSEAEEWIRCAAQDWLSRLKQITRHL